VEEELPRLQNTAELERAGRAIGTGPPGSVRTRLANAIAGMLKEHYGRGPDAAKAWILDDRYAIVILEGGLTRNEETLLAAGHADLVRKYRLQFQEAITATAVGAVEEILERKVITYHSQIVFDPVRCFEIFVLEE
jgi:uncharacterized protein YbcI